MPTVAVVLPPREGFGPGRSGAIGLLAHRLAAVSVWQTITIGGPQAGPPFADVAFRAIAPPWWLPGNINRRYAFAVGRALRRLRPDLIEVYNRPEIALALARRLPRIPVCLNLQNDPQDMRDARTAADRGALLRRLACVIVASDFLRRRLQEGVTATPRRPPVVLHNSIDLAALPQADARRPEIVFAGRVVAEKGVDTFVDACGIALAELPGWQASIIGADRSRADSPDTPFVRTVRDAAPRAGVALLGYRDHPDVLQAMARAAIVVVPSRWQEPFGLTALEAIASGAALICSPRGGLPEVAGDAALYADPDDPRAIADAILALARDPARREALGNAGRQRARQFDVRAVAASLSGLRNAIVAGGG